MRIRRSALFVIQQITKTLLRKTTFTILGAALIVGGSIVGQNILTTPRTTYATTPPDSCFSFNAGTGTIDSYFDNEGNDVANPACTRSVDIPATIGGIAVTSIGDYAFYGKQITSVTIPNSITTIGKAVFTDNLITSLTLPSSVTSLGDFAFSVNHLTSLTIPNSITSLGTAAFAMNELTSITLPEGLTTIGEGVFRNNKLTSLTIPSSVTTIGRLAFYDNTLSSPLTIPDSVTAIGDYAFEGNQLTSVTLGCGMSSIAPEVFAINKLQEVTIPDCITSIDPTAFFGQNPWGGAIDNQSDPAHDWYSSDPAVRKTVYDNVWYARLYTSDPNNPHHLVDSIANEDWYTGDISGDDDGDDSLGGHLINPASVAVRYVDGSNVSLSPDYASTGHLTDGTNLSDYLAKNVQAPPIVDVLHPTTDEQAALETALGQYYRLEQSVPLTAPAIPGYTLQHPSSPYAANLASKNNAINFTYATSQTDTSNPTPSNPTPNPSVGSVSSESTTQSKPSAQSTQSVTTTDESANSPTPVSDETRTKVDFTAPAGSATNPTTGAVPYGLEPIMAKSSLTVDDSKPCHQIDSAKLLSAASFTVPDAKYKTLGGLAFVLNCTTVGGDAAVTFTLGDTVPDVTKIKIYKQDSHGDKTDITNQVSFSNNSTHTTIRYALQDGKSLDDDGVANSSISDPIYIVTPSDITEPLAAKGTSWWGIIAVVGAIIVIGSLAGATVAYKKRHA